MSYSKVMNYTMNIPYNNICSQYSGGYNTNLNRATILFCHVSVILETHYSICINIKNMNVQPVPPTCTAKHSVRTPV